MLCEIGKAVWPEWAIRKLQRWALKLKGWRTVIFNVVTGVIVPVLELSELTAIIPQKLLPWYALGLALTNLYLRQITTTPIGEK